MNRRRLCFALCLLLVSVSAWVGHLAADDAVYKQHAAVFGEYKGHSGPSCNGVAAQSLYVPMRDGVKIAIDVLLLKDLPSDVKVPTVLLNVSDRAG